jgi:hypothetical protein
LSAVLGTDDAATTDVLFEAVDVMSALYNASTTRASVDGHQLALLVRRPLTTIAAIRTSPLRLAANEAKLACIATELDDLLAGRTLSFATVHGNLWPGNVYCNERHVTTITGWENTAVGVPVVDAMHLVWLANVLTVNTDLGAIVRRVMREGRFTPAEMRVVERVPGGSELSPRTIALLVWLRHVGGDACRLQRHDDLWRIRNIHDVIEVA